MLEKYCDLRRRGFGQQAIQTKASWPRHYPSLLLKEAQRRKMPGSQGSEAQAVTEWLLAMFDAGTELRVIQRMSAFTGLQTNKQLQAALDAASGPSPTDIIIRNPDGEPTRVSWLDTNGELMHRPFDGAFPADYPADLAVRQCTEVACRLLVYPNNSARDRAYTMLYMAEAGLHSFDYDSGRWVNAKLERTGLDEDAKHTQTSRSSTQVWFTTKDSITQPLDHSEYEHATIHRRDRNSRTQSGKTTARKDDQPIRRQPTHVWRHPLQ